MKKIGWVIASVGLLKFEGNSSCVEQKSLDYLFRNRIFHRLVVDLPFQTWTSRISNPRHVRDFSHKYFIASFNSCVFQSQMLLDRQKYTVSDSFYSLLANNDSTPVLIVDNRTAPRRTFLARYVSAAVGEGARLMFKDELTGYDYEQQVTYPTQKSRLDYLQTLLESCAFGSLETLSNVEIGNSKNQALNVRVIASKDLVTALIGLYQFAW